MSEKGFVYILKDTHFKRGVKIGRARCRGAGSKASSQRLSQLFAESIEVVLGDCAFKQ